MASDAEARARALSSALAALDAEAGRQAAIHMSACVRCGLCGQSCHIYRSEPTPANLPASKVEAVASFHRRRHTFLGRHAPRLVGARDLGPRELESLVETVFGRCTGCGRCSLHCSIGLDVSAIIRAARRVLTKAGLTPDGLRRTVRTQIETGNQMAVTPEELRETAAWISDELAGETGHEGARVPVDEAGSRVLYLVNPREIKFFPLSLQAAAGVFYAAGESWTLSTRTCDVTNYGFYAVDDSAAAELTRRVLEEADRLGASEVVLSECGHGFRSFRWEGPGWLGERPRIPFRSVLERMDTWLAEDRIPIDTARNAAVTTLHDPCNLVRWGGISEPQRNVLRKICAHFVEMTPNRADNFCCGGGGGMLSMEEFGERRVRSGSIKAEQIRATGARVVACPCHNCADQLLEITRVHGLDVEIRAVVEILYDVIDWRRVRGQTLRS